MFNIRVTPGQADGQLWQYASDELLAVEARL
jgi:hypothetical protein